MRIKKWPKPRNYYFSTPKMFQEEDLRIPIVVITPKGRWDSRRAWDCSSHDYEYLASMANNVFGLDKWIAEVVENVYEPKDIKMTCDEFKERLEQIGFVHNPDLDAGLEEQIKDLEDMGV